MTKTLLAMAFSCLMTVGMAGCGGGGDSTSDIISDMCNKMDSCGYLQGVMTVSDCKKMGEEVAKQGGEEPTAAEKDAAKACLAKSCEEFATCSGMVN